MKTDGIYFHSALYLMTPPEWHSCLFKTKYFGTNFYANYKILCVTIEFNLFFAKNNALKIPLVNQTLLNERLLVTYL